MTGTAALTKPLLMVNMGETNAPAAIVTEAGTVTIGLLLASVTSNPPVGAGPLSVTVFRVVDVLPKSNAGDSLTAEGPGGRTVRVAAVVVPLYAADILTGVLAATAVVVMENVGDTDVPAAIVTEAGTVALVLLLDSVTTAPPAGAAPLSDTVFKVADVPPTTAAGDSPTELTATPPVVVLQAGAD